MKDDLPLDLPKFSSCSQQISSIHQSFPRQNLKITNSPKFSPPQFYAIRYFLHKSFELKASSTNCCVGFNTNNNVGFNTLLYNNLITAKALTKLLHSKIFWCMALLGNKFIFSSYSFLYCQNMWYAEPKQLGAVKKGAAKQSKINAIIEYDW